MPLKVASASAISGTRNQVLPCRRGTRNTVARCRKWATAASEKAGVLKATRRKAPMRSAWSPSSVAATKYVACIRIIFWKSSSAPRVWSLGGSTRARLARGGSAPSSPPRCEKDVPTSRLNRATNAATCANAPEARMDSSASMTLWYALRCAAASAGGCAAKRRAPRAPASSRETCASPAPVFNPASARARLVSSRREAVAANSGASSQYPCSVPTPGTTVWWRLGAATAKSRKGARASSSPRAPPLPPPSARAPRPAARSRRSRRSRWK
nr:hypothetical protein Docile-S101_00050 [Bovine alphaherpesvirus 1]